MEKLNHIIEKIKSYSLAKFYIVSLIFSVLLIMLLSLITHLLGVELKNPIEDYPPVVIAISALIFAPLLETLIHQYLPYKIMAFFDLLNSRIGVLALFFIASLFFGVMHPYSLGYVIYAFIIGLIFIVLFYVSHNIRKDGKGAFWLVTLVHFTINAMALVGELWG
ncbi:MAG: CPBP family intramembrane metalloprotease [Flavobacteriaceae bacterium]|nr:CPBP family intramembrane metalloprotease [Flavobacteriaceae bacterium]